MPIQITISGDTAIEALHELRGLSNGLSGAVAPAADTRPVAEEVPAGDEKAFPEPKPTRKPRAAKAEPEAVEQPAPMADKVAEEGTIENADADERQAEEAEKPFTVDDARTALSDLLKQPDGKTKAQAVFAEMGCTKLSEIPEGSYKAFIAAIAKARGL
jgi:hypothetical protein